MRKPRRQALKSEKLRALQKVVVLIDICSFSEMEIEKQIASVLDLQKVCLDLMKKHGLSFSERIPIGDGFIFGMNGQHSVEALNFCISLQKKILMGFRKARYQIRCAINYGNVFEYTDINGNANIIGDAVNVCARIAAKSNPGSIILRDTHYNILSEIDHRLSQKVRKYGVVNGKHSDEAYTVYYYVDEIQAIGNRIPYGRRTK